MKARIRKKGKDKYGNSRYILEWAEDGKLYSYTLNPKKILDYIKKSKILKEKNK